MVASFKFIDDKLSGLVSYNCSKAEVVIGDFSKGLGASMTAVDTSLTKIIKQLVCYIITLPCLRRRSARVLENSPHKVTRVQGLTSRRNFSHSWKGINKKNFTKIAETTAAEIIRTSTSKPYKTLHRKLFPTNLLRFL